MPNKTPANSTENSALTLTDEEREALKELVIDENNFDEYFFDARKHGPKLGQILACYDANAEFVDGNLKRDLIHLLMTNHKGGEASIRLLQKLGGATSTSALPVVKEMMRDLLSGKSSDEVAAKAYSFQCQFFYYTWRECMPKDDPHWWSTALVDVSGWDEADLERLFPDEPTTDESEISEIDETH
jgi:hypothetical protein